MGSVTFFIPDDNQVQKLRNAEPDRDWKLFSTGVDVWIGQTYLRLKQRGHNVTLSAAIPDEGILVAHADHVPTVLAERRWTSNLVIISARADRPTQRFADFEVVQNSYSSNLKNTFYIQHWPQPGLIPRDRRRKNIVRNVAFKGTLGEMAPEFASIHWANALLEQGIEWKSDAVEWGGNSAVYETNWNDYSDTDVIVAMRKDLSNPYTKKPASKLINAWLAGVPAILGPEQAYRELRRSMLDYIEVAAAEEAAVALARLKSDPELYGAMVENGRRRAEEVMADECAKTWEALLFEIIPRQLTPPPLRFVRLTWYSLRYRVLRILRKNS